MAQKSPLSPRNLADAQTLLQKSRPSPQQTPPLDRPE